MNNRFPILSFVSTCLKILGWLFVISGLLYVVAAGIIEPSKQGHSFGLSDAIDILTGLGIVISGLLTAAFGEIIGVLFAIEDNTRKTYDAVSSTKSSSQIVTTSTPIVEEKAKEAILELSSQEMYDNGECPACGEKIDKNEERCIGCDELLIEYMG